MTINNTSRAALVVSSFIALGGCSSMYDHREARTSPAESSTSASSGYTPASSAPSAQAQVAPPPPEVTPRLLKRVQTTLHGDRLYAGKIDGLWGAKTTAALKRYQKSHNLTDNGEIDTATLDSLGISTASAAPAPQPNASASAAGAPGTAAASDPPAVTGGSAAGGAPAGSGAAATAGAPVAAGAPAAN